MIEVRERHGGSVVALMEVAARADPPVRLRGGRPDRRGRRGPGHRPGREAGARGGAEQPGIIGRYVLEPAVFDVLRGPRRAAAARSSSPTRCARLRRRRRRRRARRAVPRPPLRHRRPAEYLRTVVQLACERADLGPEFGPGSPDFVTRQRDERDRRRTSSPEIGRGAPGLDPGHRVAGPATRAAAARRAGLRARRGRGLRGRLPPFDNSAMDGYAVRPADVARRHRDAPVVLPVVGDIAAGAVPAPTRSPPGTCARIMTGAPVPAGADAVVPVE